ncbi:hypothetical protein GC176_11810 [bacterium]|nr:hypothetical protein [bacterium]
MLRRVPRRDSSETGRAEEHLRSHGCVLHHHGGKHDVWLNPVELTRVPVPGNQERDSSRHLPGSSDSCSCFDLMQRPRCLLRRRMIKRPVYNKVIQGVDWRKQRL